VNGTSMSARHFLEMGGGASPDRLVACARSVATDSHQTNTR
jgi:hypothetical protein